MLGLLDDPVIAKALIAVFVKRLGGKVRVTQKDLDGVAYMFLYEEQDSEDGAEFIDLTLEEKTRQ